MHSFIQPLASNIIFNSVLFIVIDIQKYAKNLKIQKKSANDKMFLDCEPD
jgi:hypothetical protein